MVICRIFMCCPFCCRGVSRRACYKLQNSKSSSKGVCKWVLHFRICQKTEKEGSNGLAFEFGILGKLAFGGGELAKMPNFPWLGKRRIRGFLVATMYSRAVGLFFAPQIGCRGSFASPDRARCLASSPPTPPPPNRSL